MVDLTLEKPCLTMCTFQKQSGLYEKVVSSLLLKLFKHRGDYSLE